MSPAFVGYPWPKSFRNNLGLNLFKVSHLGQSSQSNSRTVLLLAPTRTCKYVLSIEVDLWSMINFVVSNLVAKEGTSSRSEILHPIVLTNVTSMSGGAFDKVCRIGNVMCQFPFEVVQSALMIAIPKTRGGFRGLYIPYRRVDRSHQ